PIPCSTYFFKITHAGIRTSAEESRSMILVTGGAGYIGSHYVLHERARGSDVLVLDNLIYGHREAVLDTRLIVGEVGDHDLLGQIFQDYPIDSVVHFAAFAS